MNSIINIFIYCASFFLLISCKTQSKTYSLYASYGPTHSTLLLNNETEQYVLSNGYWTCIGEYSWNNLSDTLTLNVKKLSAINIDSITHPNKCFIEYKKIDNNILPIKEYYKLPEYEILWIYNLIPEGLSKLPILKTKDEKIWLKYGAVIN